jgi:hypothetical protein
MIHLTIPPQVGGLLIALLFLTHGIAYIIGMSRR